MITKFTLQTFIFTGIIVLYSFFFTACDTTTQIDKATLIQKTKTYKEPKVAIWYYTGSNENYDYFIYRDLGIEEHYKVKKSEKAITKEIRFIPPSTEDYTWKVMPWGTQTPTPVDKNDTNRTDPIFQVPPITDVNHTVEPPKPNKHNCVDVLHFHSYPNYTHKITLKKPKNPEQVHIVQYTNWTKEYNGTNEQQNYHMRSTSYSGGQLIGILKMNMATIETFTLNTQNIMPIREITQSDTYTSNGTYTAANGMTIHSGGQHTITRYVPYKLYPTELCLGIPITTDFIEDHDGARGTRQRFTEQVMKIGVQKHVIAGTFKTVHVHHVSVSPTSLEGDSWFDLKTGVMVYSSDGTQVTELIHIDK